MPFVAGTPPVASFVTDTHAVATAVSITPEVAAVLAETPSRESIHDGDGSTDGSSVNDESRRTDLSADDGSRDSRGDTLPILLSCRPSPSPRPSSLTPMPSRLPFLSRMPLPRFALEHQAATGGVMATDAATAGVLTTKAAAEIG